MGAYYDENGDLHGFLLIRGAYTSLEVPGSDRFTYAQGINDGGLIVGLYGTADGATHGFVLSDGGYTTVDVPNSFWTEIYSVNANGDIVGAFGDASGIHAFRGTPAGRLVPDAPAE